MAPELYLVTPPVLDPQEFAPRLEAALDAGPVACVQLWLHDRSALASAAAILKPIVQQRDRAFLVNGDVALARSLDCDGVHLDSSDPAAVREARKILGAERIIGVSCRSSRHAAMEAAEAGADYVSFGPIFASPTKAIPADDAALETLGWWAEMMEVPCVAIGGITAERIAPLTASGCEFVCALSFVWNHPDGPAAGVAALTDAIGLD